jgi:shikimate kinase/3-dehydroquinate synthase
LLFLIGFMAAGKTSVGRTLAANSQRAFVDLDDRIASTAGEPVAALVARDEAAFRVMEAAALAALIDAGGDVVVATGGGAAGHGDNLVRMREAGCVIALGIDVAVARQRAAADAGSVRPNLARADALAALRAPIYRRAHAVIETTDSALDDVVAQVAAAERAWLALPAGQARRETIVVGLGARSYPVVFADAIDSDLCAIVRSALPGISRIALITDDNVFALHGPSASRALAAAGLRIVHIHSVPPGEISKSLAEYRSACEALIGKGLDRGSAIVALGGGVVGDLAGFVAATLFRGIPIIHLPTTLVAMTDSAIGGKTAIDLPAGKNLVGAFHQPALVACALGTLSTLPARERRAGFGELWKYALLDGAEMWDAVEACAPWAAAAEDGVIPPPALREAITRAVAYKAAIVSRDEREQTGHRALLNLGHTVGHAIEAAAGGQLLHGEAVGLGLIAACRVSAALGAPSCEAEVRTALAASGLPTDLESYLTPAVLARVSVDKKRVGSTLRFVTIRDVGRCAVTDIAIEDLPRILLPALTP